MEQYGNDTYPFYDFDENISTFETVLQRLETCFIIPLGLLGNSLIIIILTQKKNRQYASSMILASLAVSDIIILLHGLYIFLPTSVEITTLECKLSAFFAFSSVQTSSMLLVLVASERAIAVTMPLKVKLIFSVKNVKLAIISVVSLICIMNICILVSFDVNYLDHGFYTGCDAVGQLEYFMVEIYPWLDSIIAFSIPYVIITISSVVIIVKLSKGTLSKRNDKMTSVTRTLLAANLAFLISQCPFGVFQLFYPVPPSDDYAEYNIYSGLITLSQVNASANFFLYFLSGPKFRADVKNFFKCCISRQIIVTKSNSNIAVISSATANIQQNKDRQLP